MEKKLTCKQIQDLAKHMVTQRPGGIRYTPLVEAIQTAAPLNPKNAIRASVWNLDDIFPNEITKPSRGLFAPIGAESDTETVPEDMTANAKYHESDFYRAFAEWLKKDLDEVTEVAPLGGAGMGKKWGTPDVIGVYKPRAGDLVKFPLEIVSGEVKIDSSQPVVAFGQAVAYRLFSGKTYIAMPTSLTDEDLSRLDSLSMLFGVGLVLFELNPSEPNFQIRVRAQRFLADMFYVNEFADRLRQHDKEVFEKLFQ